MDLYAGRDKFEWASLINAIVPMPNLRFKENVQQMNLVYEDDILQELFELLPHYSRYLGGDIQVDKFGNMIWSEE